MEPKLATSPTSSAADIARGRIVPWVIAAFFTAFIVPLLVFTWIAFRHPAQTVTDHAYDKGLGYNRTLAAEAEMGSLGWTVKLGMQGYVLTATFADKDANPLQGAFVKVWFVRPSQADMDQQTAMQETAPGRYEAVMPYPAPGLWQIRVTAEHAGRQFQVARDFSVR